MHHHLSTLRAALLVTCASSMLGGCVVAAVGAGAAAGGYTLSQERGASGVVSDTSIKAQINAKWNTSHAAIASYVDLNIFQGRVLLTGVVPTPNIKDEAVALVRQVKGVQELIDQIHVGPRSTFNSAAKDNWILARLNAALTFDGDIRSLNYSLQCVDGTVYILGSARSQVELDKVVDHARNIPGVVQVFSYIRIRIGVDGAQPAPPPPGPAPVVSPDGNVPPTGYQGGGSGGYQSPPPSYRGPSSAPPADDVYPPASPPPANYGQSYGGQNPNAPIPLDQGPPPSTRPGSIQAQPLQ